MLKKTKFFVGISLIVQSMTFLVVFIVLWVKKKSLWKTFLIVGLCGGVTGTVLAYKSLKDDRKFRAMMRAVDTLCDYDTNYDVKDILIETDDSASESDFE